MKIRNGFVSNSSSSSFIIGGTYQHVTKEELVKLLEEGYKGSILFDGPELAEGDFIRELTEKEKDFIVSNPDRFLANSYAKGAYIGDYTFRPEPWTTDWINGEEPTLAENEKRVYVDNNVDVYDEDFKQFVISNFFTSAEYEDWDEFAYEIGKPFIILYKQRTTKLDEALNYENLFVGKNEFGSSNEIDGVAFSFRKVEENDIEKLKNSKRTLTFYDDLKVLKDKGKITLNGEYYSQYLRGVSFKNKGIRNFI